jgi:hypothetical protein
MMEHKNKIDNWAHYWSVASSRKDLKEFKNLLHINANSPNIDLSKQQVPTKDGIKTFDQLIKELAPTPNENGELN